MPPRRSAQSRKAKSPAVRTKRAPQTQTPNMQCDSGADGDANENHARKRQRREPDHHEGDIGNHVLFAETTDAAPAEPLADASNFAAPPSAGDNSAYASIFDFQWLVDQAPSLQWDEASAGLGIGEDLTQGLAPVAGPSHGLGDGTQRELNGVADMEQQRFAYSQADTGDVSYMGSYGLPLGDYLLAGSYDAPGVGEGMPGPSTNPAPAPAAFTQDLGLGDAAFNPLDHLPPLQAPAAGSAYTGPTMSDLLALFAGSGDVGLPFAGSEGLPLAEEMGLPFTGNGAPAFGSDDGWSLASSFDALLGNPGQAPNPPEGNPLGSLPTGGPDAGDGYIPSLHDGSSDPSMHAASLHAAFGHRVQTQNTFTPQEQPQPSGSRAPPFAPAREVAAMPPQTASEEAGEEQDPRSHGPLTDAARRGIRSTWARKRDRAAAAAATAAATPTTASARTVPTAPAASTASANSAVLKACELCDQRNLTETAYEHHLRRDHNEYERAFGQRYPCVLCNDTGSRTSVELYQRHRKSPRCKEMRRVDGNYDALMRVLIEREVAKGAAGRGLACLAHWQFGAADSRGKCFRGLRDAWYRERARRGELWRELTQERGWDDRIPKMELVPVQGSAGPRAKMEWLPSGQFYN